jgi:glycosyltransferase involved in cell wall biosynthesis
MPQVDGVVGVSQATLRAVRDFYALDVPSINIPRGVVPAALIPERPRETVRRELGVPPTAPVLVFVGSLSREKRLDRFLQTTQRVLAALPDLSVWLVGDGPLRAEIEKQIKARELGGRVHLLGIQASVATYMSAADLLLLTSDTEGIPGVVLEAGVLGLPVVATRVGGLPECVLDGETGILVDPQDEKALTQAVLDLLRDQARRVEMGRRARPWIQARFTMDAIAQRYVDFYRHVREYVDNASP